MIGVGRGINRKELDHIAGGSGKAFIAESFDVLIGSTFTRGILALICKPSPGE